MIFKLQKIIGNWFSKIIENGFKKEALVIGMTQEVMMVLYLISHLMTEVLKERLMKQVKSFGSERN